MLRRPIVKKKTDKINNILLKVTIGHSLNAM